MVTVFPPVGRWKNWSTNKLTNLTKVTQLARDTTGIWTLISLSLEPILLTTIYSTITLSLLLEDPSFFLHLAYLILIPRPFILASASIKILKNLSQKMSMTDFSGNFPVLFLLDLSNASNHWLLHRPWDILFLDSHDDLLLVLLLYLWMCFRSRLCCSHFSTETSYWSFSFSILFSLGFLHWVISSMF